MLRGVTQISAGTDHTCAVQSGVAKCWGENDSGQVGDGTTTTRRLPHRVIGLPGRIVRTNAGYYQSCALQATPGRGNALWCWGGNTYGELGNGTTKDSRVPVRVIGLQAHVKSVSGNLYFTCALQLGAAKCWGYDFDGQLGDGGHGARSTARLVNRLGTGVKQVSSAWASACAMLSNGGVRCWGSGSNGELGNGSKNGSRVPTSVRLV
jgi:alpha-tubulin suppressor-like RCC1 family protein